MPVYVKVIYRVLYDALYHFTDDDGWAMASHVALSSLLAIFPFLIFGTSLATFLGAKEFADTAVHLIFDTWPSTIAEPIAREVVQVLTIPHGGLLTVSVLAAAYFASNGIEALRISLNRAYRVHEMRPWYITRAISLVLCACCGARAGCRQRLPRRRAPRRRLCRKLAALYDHDHQRDRELACMGPRSLC